MKKNSTFFEFNLFDKTNVTYVPGDSKTGTHIMKIKKGNTKSDNVNLPGKELINNIMSYSKALAIIKSTCIGNMHILMN